MPPPDPYLEAFSQPYSDAGLGAMSAEDILMLLQNEYEQMPERYGAYEPPLSVQIGEAQMPMEPRIGEAQMSMTPQIGEAQMRGRR